MPIPSLDADGFLPPGRYRATMEEVHSRYVAPRREGHQRYVVWEDWLDVTELLRKTVGQVAAVWLGGSFLSNKDAPDDIDCVYVVATGRLTSARAVESQAQTLQMLTDHSPSGLRAAFGIRVDSYVLEWPLNPSAAPQTAEDIVYCQNRGYWDDFWQRRRSGGKMAPEDGLPRRGYLEVILDGYEV